MRTVAAALLMLVAPISQQVENAAVEPIVEGQPLESPSFVLIHTNDTRGYLESCG